MWSGIDVRAWACTHRLSFHQETRTRASTHPSFVRLSSRSPTGGVHSSSIRFLPSEVIMLRYAVYVWSYGLRFGLTAISKLALPPLPHTCLFRPPTVHARRLAGSACGPSQQGRTNYGPMTASEIATSTPCGMFWPNGRNLHWELTRSPSLRVTISRSLQLRVGL